MNALGISVHPYKYKYFLCSVLVAPPQKKKHEVGKGSRTHLEGAPTAWHKEFHSLCVIQIRRICVRVCVRVFVCLCVFWLLCTLVVRVVIILTRQEARGKKQEARSKCQDDVDLCLFRVLNNEEN